MTPQDEIVVSAEGLELRRDGGPGLLMRWEEVYAISFCRIDAVPSVITYLTFDYQWGEFVEVTDSMEGFAALVSELPKRLPITLSGWQEAMGAASPQDEPVTIYQRSNAEDVGTDAEIETV